MFGKFPKDDRRTLWTSHVKRKMLFYGLSEQRIRSILRNYERKEDGIAPQTVAVMLRNDKPKKKEEIWVMYATKALKMVIVSAWRYPGITKVKDKPMVPDDVMDELDRFLKA